MRFHNVPSGSQACLETRRIYLRSFKFTFTHVDDVGNMARQDTFFILTNGCRYLAEFFRSHSEDSPICGRAPGMQSHACVTSVPSGALYFSLPLSTTSTSSVHRQSSVFAPCSSPNIVVRCKGNRDAEANPQHSSCISRDEYGEWSPRAGNSRANRWLLPRSLSAGGQRPLADPRTSFLVRAPWRVWFWLSRDQWVEWDQGCCA